MLALINLARFPRIDLRYPYGVTVISFQLVRRGGNAGTSNTMAAISGTKGKG